MFLFQAICHEISSIYFCSNTLLSIMKRNSGTYKEPFSTVTYIPLLRLGSWSSLGGTCSKSSSYCQVGTPGRISGKCEEAKSLEHDPFFLSLPVLFMCEISLFLITKVQVEIDSIYLYTAKHVLKKVLKLPIELGRKLHLLRTLLVWNIKLFLYPFLKTFLLILLSCTFLFVLPPSSPLSSTLSSCSQAPNLFRRSCLILLPV